MGGDKLEKLLQAAAQVIGEKGYAQAKMADIADAAGIGKGTIYEYFTSKETLLEGLMEYMMQQAGQEMLTMDLTAPPLANIGHIIRSGLTVMETMKDTITLTVDFWSAALKNKDSRIFKMMQAMYNEMVGLIKTLVVSGQEEGSMNRETDPECFGMILFSILDESFMHEMLCDHEFDRQRFIDETQRMVNTYLLPQPMR